MKLGSLFDGSGGFPLAGALFGIEPVWASEIELFPIRVTKKRFPNMKHLGSVTEVHGDQVEPVDIITFGSPCQDLSIAGKMAGIHEGERSNLFFEAIRIIKEMRERDRSNGRSDVDIRPRFAVWENVTGAFSTNKGKDFQAVLQAFSDLCGGGIVPGPPKGKWKPAGCVVGDGWSIAWRVYDAQFWGVPQRRKRIYLIADFAGERAGEILFEPESMHWDSEESREARERASRYAQGCPDGSDWFRWDEIVKAKVFNESGRGYWMEGFGRIRAEGENRPSRPGHIVVACDPRGNISHGGGIAPTITGDHNNRITDYTIVVCAIASSCLNAEMTDGTVSPTILARADTGGNQLPLIVIDNNADKGTL